MKSTWISYLDRLTHSRELVRLAVVICILVNWTTLKIFYKTVMQFVLVVLLIYCSRCDAVDGAWLQCNAVAHGLKIRPRCIQRDETSE